MNDNLIEQLKKREIQLRYNEVEDSVWDLKKVIMSAFHEDVAGFHKFYFADAGLNNVYDCDDREVPSLPVIKLSKFFES